MTKDTVEANGGTLVVDVVGMVDVEVVEEEVRGVTVPDAMPIAPRWRCVDETADPHPASAVTVKAKTTTQSPGLRRRPRSGTGEGTSLYRRLLAVLSAAGLILCGCGSATMRAAVTDRGRRAPMATSSSTTTTTTTTSPAAGGASATAGSCPPGLAGRLATAETASQVVTVDAPGYSTTYATLTAWSRERSCWVAALGPWTARIGAAGFSDHKTEGDNTTPTGVYGIAPVMYGNAVNPGVSYGYHPLVCGDWWDEDPSSPQYNSFEHVPCGQRPSFGGDSEMLWEETTANPSFAVIDYNTDPVTRSAGSGIFIHADVGGPTAGCVSLPLSELDALLGWLAPAASPAVVMGPDSEIIRF